MSTSIITVLIATAGFVLVGVNCASTGTQEARKYSSSGGHNSLSGKRCDIPPSAPKKIEDVINQCQDEIKLAILSEALEALSISEHSKGRSKRDTFSEDEKRIAGCLLQCVYRKMNAVNEQGFPTVDGLAALYSEGVNQKDYVIATYQAVNVCLANAQKKHLITPQSLQEHGKTCDIAYDVFDCVSEKIGEYCGQTP